MLFKKYPSFKGHVRFLFVLTKTIYSFRQKTYEMPLNKKIKEKKVTIIFKCLVSSTTWYLYCCATVSMSNIKLEKFNIRIIHTEAHIQTKAIGKKMENEKRKRKFIIFIY